MTQRDHHVVLHATLAATGGIIVFAIFAVAIPDLFNRHSSLGDTLAIALAIVTTAFAYLIGRHLWRSFNSDGDIE